MASSVCQSCLTVVDDAGRFHPHEFCLLRKAGLSERQIAAFVRKASSYMNPDGTWRLVREGPRGDEEAMAEMRQWLSVHEDTPPRDCALCEEPVAKDTVMDHLLERHEPFQVALLVALWWFLPDEDEEATP